MLLAPNSDNFFICEFSLRCFYVRYYLHDLRGFHCHGVECAPNVNKLLSSDTLMYCTVKRLQASFQGTLWRTSWGRSGGQPGGALGDSLGTLRGDTFGGGRYFWSRRASILVELGSRGGWVGGSTGVGQEGEGESW